MKNLMFVVLITLVCLLGGMALFGCGPHPTAQTQSQITQIQQDNLVDVAAEQAKARLQQQQAADNPAAHPIIAASNAVKTAQKPLGLIATISFLIAAVGVGLYFTPLSAFSKIIVPVAGGVSAFSFFGVIALPFFPWVGLGAVVLVLGLFIYEVIRAKSLKGGIEATEGFFDQGFHIVPSTAPLAIPGGSTITTRLSHL